MSTTTAASIPDAYDVLASLYGLIALTCVVQVYRIARRTPKHVGFFTTQQVFHLANLFTSTARACAFFGRSAIEKTHTINAIVNDGPGLVFLSTYAGLVLFWSDIYHAARGEAARTRRARTTFYAVNVVAYATELGIWSLMAFGKEKWRGDALERASSGTLAFASASVALAFAFYGSKLYVMLREFPEGLTTRAKKIREIGSVTAVCVTAFAVRCVVLFLATGGEAKYAVDVYASKTMNVAYYVAVEILPSALVLYVLRKLPPKRARAASFADEDSDASARAEEADSLRHPLVVDSDDDESDDEDADAMGS